MIVVSLFLVAVLASALFSGLETGIYTTSRLRLFLDAEARVGAARRALDLLTDIPTLLTVLLVCNNVANAAASFLAQQALADWGVTSREVVGTLGVSSVLFVLAESVPKNAFRRGREALLYPALPVLDLAHRLLSWPTRPVTWFSRLLARAVARRLGAAKVPQGERERMLDTGAREGLLNAFQGRVAGGVLGMRSQKVKDLAVPLQRYPRARMGRSEVELPPEGRDHRALVLDAGGSAVVGWTPLVTLWEGGAWRGPRRRDVQRVVRLDPSTRLDRAYAILNRARSPFAVIHRNGAWWVLDAHRLRSRLLGTVERPRGGAGESKQT